MNNKMSKNILVSGVVVTLSFLPGCTDMFKGSNNQVSSASMENKSSQSVPMTGEVLVTMKGAAAITTDSLEKEKEKLLKANPNLRQAIAFMDAREIDRNILEGLVQQKIVDEYILANKINETAAYQSELRDLYESMERMLNSKYFTERNSVTISESEIKNFYETNKDKSLKISQGGVVATGIEFTDGATARAFAARAKTSQGGFKKVAQEDGLNAKIKDFKQVNSQSIGIDEQLRDKIAAMKTVPSVEVIENNGAFWVVNATAKEDAKYVPYDQIKDRIKEQLEQQKRVEVFTKDVEKLKNEYGVEINEDYFKVESPESAAQSQAMTNVTAPQAPAQDQRMA